MADPIRNLAFENDEDDDDEDDYDDSLFDWLEDILPFLLIAFAGIYIMSQNTIDKNGY